MKALKTHKADEINGVASKNIDRQSSIITDKSTSYEDFSSLFIHACFVQIKLGNHENLAKMGTCDNQQC
jgi:hypothetical protein